MHICASMIQFIILMLSCEHILSNIIKDCVFLDKLFKFQASIIVNIESIVKEH